MESNHLISAVVDAAWLMMDIWLMEVTSEGNVLDSASYMMLVSMQCPSPCRIYTVHQRLLEFQGVSLDALDGKVFIDLYTLIDESLPLRCFHLIRGNLLCDGCCRFAAAFQ